LSTCVCKRAFSMRSTFLVMLEGMLQVSHEHLHT
jgi:hypothetical protein